MSDLSSEYVYAIEHPDGYFKIGRGREPYQRLSQVQVGSPYKLELRYVLKYLPSRFDPDPEPELHKRFADRCVRGEWHDVTEDEVLNAFESLVDDEEQAPYSLIDIQEREDRLPEWKQNLGRRPRL